MTQEFSRWLAAQKPADFPIEADDDEDQFRMECYGCGKIEYITRADYESGDKGWYARCLEEGIGVCGGSQFCLP